MMPQVLAANPRVADDTGRVAVQRGPLIYCLEGIDQPQGVELSEVGLRLGKQPESEFHSEFRGDLLDGVVVLHHPGLVSENPASSVLYPRYRGESVKTRRVDTDVHSLLRMVEPHGDGHAGLDTFAGILIASADRN